MSLRQFVGAALLIIASPEHIVYAGETNEHGARPVVELTIVGSSSDPLTEATIRELLERLGVDVVSPPAPPGARVLSRARVDLTSPKAATVIVVDAHDEHVVLERETPPNATPSLRREVLAHDIQSAIEAELEEETLPPDAGKPPEPVPVPEPVPEPATAFTSDTAPASPPRASSSKTALDVAMFGGAGPIASSSGLGPRLGGALTLRSSSFSLSATGAYAVPFESSSELVTARVSFFAVRILPGVRVVETGRFAFDAVVGGGVDVLAVDPSSSSLPPSTIGLHTTRIDPIVSTLLTTHVRLMPAVFAFVAGGVDVALSTRDYVVRRRDSEDDVFAPWRVRPTLLAGFGFTAFGDRGPQ
jgi:hypothetical protein